MLGRAFASFSTRAALLAVALAAAPLPAQSAANAVHVTGSILDSLTNAPLGAASVHFLRADDLGSESIGARTDAAGKFEISLAPGRWLVGIEHPRFDSLAIALPARRIEIPAKPSFRLALATASAHTLTQAFCGKDARDDDVVVVGVVQNAGSGAPLDSADVLVQWATVRIAQGSGAKVIASTVAARTDRNGWYVLCGSPRHAQIVAWAERGPTATDRSADFRRADATRSLARSCFDTVCKRIRQHARDTLGSRRDAQTTVRALGRRAHSRARHRRIGQTNSWSARACNRAPVRARR
jgi:hypothetical protein